MSRQQFGYLVGFFAVAVWAVAGFCAAAGAVLAGVVGWLVVRTLDGELDVAAIIDRVSPAGRRRR
ncbi:MAG: hypothetical protein HKP61_08290 [Dactylosporangium sp.]|nr:hypothetical protein [Dactylosporangium sp.]NNJ60936.1 hypothetical protein [Dactylosporangium sp.]